MKFTDDLYFSFTSIIKIDFALSEVYKSRNQISYLNNRHL